MLPRDRFPSLRLDMPIAILADGYAPLAFLAAELLLAVAPFLPWDTERIETLARRWQSPGEPERDAAGAVKVS
ncbi:MAG: hypothetical protein RMN24_08815 [Anaerolineae bacterium]|nr:hypothetical protein [Anaerolineae bacterium]